MRESSDAAGSERAEEPDITTGAAVGVGRDGWATVDDGVRLHYVEAGRGPLVVLLHGFPQYWGAWRRQIPALAAAGLRVVAPDLRGYNLSGRPAGVHAYDVSRLAWDVVALVRQLGETRASIVGHDWGGVVAWYLAAHHPAVVDKLAVINAPHPRQLQRAMRTTDQPLRSWYVGFFQLPWLPEALMRAGDFALLVRALRRGAFDDAEIERHRAALRRPRALTAAVNYYRAALRRTRRHSRAVAVIDAPTLVLWGERDPYLNPKLLDGLEREAPGLRVVHLPEATHWVMEDAPARVNAELVAFLRA